MDSAVEIKFPNQGSGRGSVPRIKLVSAVLSLLLACAMLLNAAGCLNVRAAELTEGLTPADRQRLPADETFAAAGNDFAGGL